MLMLAGSEVSIVYNIDLDLTQIPENLIFYYDEYMTNAIYKNSGKINLNGYFDAYDNNKTENRTLYWKWDMETGSTQEEIDSNDLLDINWMGRSIVIGVVATGSQVRDNMITTNQCAQVTFDANGGTIQGYGNSSKITKSVVPEEQYGELPTPTRKGYEFLGWNGKNLLNYNELSELSKNDVNYGSLYIDENGYLGDNSPNGDPRGWTYFFCNWYTKLDPRNIYSNI